MPPSRKRARGASSSDASHVPSALVAIADEPPNAHWAKLSQFRAAGKLVDVMVKAGGEDFPAHRTVLAASSDFMDALFSSGMRDADADVITLGDDVSAPIFSAILSFVYDGKCEVPEAQLPEMIAAASRLQILSLQEAAVATAKSILVPGNALSLWSVGESLQLPALVTAATEVAVKDFPKLDMEVASPSQLSALLQADKLNVESEEAVFEGIVRWADATRPAEADLMGVLRHVRFGLMKADFLGQTVRAWAPMKTLAGATLLIDAMTPCFSGGTPPTARKPMQVAIEWQVFDSNMTMTHRPDGVVVFSRANADSFDVALGPELTVGRHEWMVHCGHSEFVGVAAPTYSAFEGLEDWKEILAVSSLSLSLFGRTDGRDPEWTSPAVEQDGRRIRVFLDMEARTLSFARDEGPMRVGYRNLPDRVRPFLCSGNSGEVIRVSRDN